MSSYPRSASEHISGTRAPDGQINPFVLPSETNIRFVLQVVAAIALALNLGFILGDRLGMIALSDIAAFISDAGTVPVGGTAREYQEFFIRDLRVAEQLLIAISFPLILTCAMLGLAFWLYRTHPRRIRARATVTDFEAAQDPLLDLTMRTLATQAGVAHLPAVELEGNSRTTNSFIFGLPKRYTLRLGRGWKYRMHQSPDTFRALFLHEMAHIVNRDIGRSQFSQALWVALMALVCVPVALMAGLRFIVAAVDLVSAIMQGRNWYESLLMQFWKLLFIYLQIGIMVAVVLAVRASFLRVREFYADWRVALWGAWQPLVDLIERQPADTSRKRWLNRLFWSYHPQPADRLAALREPQRLFRPAFDLAFFVGFFLALLVESGLFILIMLGMLLLTLTELVGSAALANGESVVLIAVARSAMPLLALVVVLGIAGLLLGIGYLISETLGLEVERAALADLIIQPRRNPYLSLLGMAAATALGLQLGLYFTPYSIFSQLPGPVILIALLYLVASTVLIWLWLCYVYIGARRLLGSHVGQSPPAFKRDLLSAIFFGVGCVMVVPLLLSQNPGLFLLNPSGSLSLWLVLAVLCVTAGLALVMYGGTVLITGLIFALYRRIAAVRCLACGQPVAASTTVGEQCRNCRHALSPWLFVSASLEPVPQSRQPGPWPRFRLQRPILWFGSLVLPSLLALFFLNWYTVRFITNPSEVAAFREIAGSYQVQGAAAQGGNYSGTLAIKRDGTTYDLEWQTTDGVFIGTGIRDQSLLIAVYGKPQKCTGLAYRIDAQGVMHGQWVIHGQQEIGEEQAVPQTRTDAEIGGVYGLGLPGLRTSPYSGTLTITKTRDTHALQWQTSIGAFDGTGIHQGETLAAVYGEPGCGVVLYHIQADGNLDGQWTAYRSSYIGVEQAFMQKQSSALPDERSLASPAE